jgi:hypothetical protein
MGFRGQFAQQQTETVHVRFGSKADMDQAPSLHVEGLRLASRDLHQDNWTSEVRPGYLRLLGLANVLLRSRGAMNRDQLGTLS